MSSPTRGGSCYLVQLKRRNMNVGTSLGGFVVIECALNPAKEPVEPSTCFGALHRGCMGPLFEGY